MSLSPEARKTLALELSAAMPPCDCELQRLEHKHATTHLILLGSNACAVTFPDAASERIADIVAKLMNAANAVAYLASMEHERADMYMPHAAGAATAMEVLTCLANALTQETAANGQG